MIYQYSEAIEKGILEDCFVVPMRAKEVPIHQGHIELIKYAQGLGKTFILIKLNYDVFLHHLLSGKKSSELPEEYSRPKDIQVQLNSIEGLGVDIVLESNTHEVNEQIRKEYLEMFKKRLDGMSDRLLSNNRKSPCIIKLMEYRFGRTVSSNEISVRGPEPENFLLKEAISKINNEKNIGLPDPTVIFPNMIKDENGLTLRTNYPTMSEEDNQILKTIPREIENSRKQFVTGNNSKLVKKLNQSIEDQPWKYEEILVWEGGAFGKYTVESIVINFNGQRIEEVTCY